MPHVLVVGGKTSKVKSDSLYTKYHNRYYRKVTWTVQTNSGPMVHQGFEFRPRRFVKLEKAKKEAGMLARACGTSSTLIRLPDGKFSFIPSNQNQEIAIHRMCKLLGAEIVDYVVCWSL